MVAVSRAFGTETVKDAHVVNGDIVARNALTSKGK